MMDVGEIAGTVPVNVGEKNMEQLALTVDEACTAARIGRTALYEAIASGALVARKRGRRTLFLPADLREWIDRLPSVQTKHTDRTIETSGPGTAKKGADR
jgi:excisionase family DNA binding protein